MIDPSNDEKPVCECRPCKTCAGAGESFFNAQPCAPFYSSQEVWIRCGDCRGTRVNAEDCGIHGPIETPTPAEWTALQIVGVPMPRPKPPQRAGLAVDGHPKEAA